MADEQSPMPADLQAYADRLAIPLPDERADALAQQFEGQDAILSGLDTLTDPEPPNREFWEPDDDPLGTWLVRCDVSRTTSGPLGGFTVGIKDNVAVAGVPMTCGSPLLDDREYVPPRDATVVDRLLDAGASIVGKTNMDEFAFGGSRDSMRLRLARNPHDPERQPGSSSAGSGIAAATGAVDLAVGSDTGGSVRFPAAWSGVPGLKPTRGLVSHNGFVQFARTLDNVGFLAPNVENLARGLDAVAGPDPGDERTCGVRTEAYVDAVTQAARDDVEGLVIGVPTELRDGDDEVEETVEAALARLQDSGAILREVSIPDYDLWTPAWLALGMTEVGTYLRDRAVDIRSLTPAMPTLTATLHEALLEDADGLGDPLVSALLYAEHRRDVDGHRAYLLGHRARERLTAGIDSALSEVDVLASSTVPTVAPRWDEPVEDLFGALSHTGPFNVSGHPAVSVPCGAIDGLPVGLQFIAPRQSDAMVLQVARHWTDVRDDN